MPEYIPEPDWKVLRRLREAALERLCERILNELKAVADDESMSMHERYGTVYGLIKERNEDVAMAFDGLSRSNAMTKLAIMQSMDLITGDEFQQFSEPTRSELSRRRVLAQQVHDARDENDR